jgi:hypothetical protein
MIPSYKRALEGCFTVAGYASDGDDDTIMVMMMMMMVMTTR